MTVLRARALSAFATGLRAAGARPWVVAAVWAWHLLVAAAVSLPLFRGLLSATALAPATDQLLQRFSFSLFAELLQYNEAPLLPMLQAGAIGGVIVALVSAPALLPAILTSLESPRPVGPGELAAASGRFYWRFLRLFVFGRVVGVIVAVIVGAGVAAALTPVRHSLWEVGRLASPLAVLLAGLTALALCWGAVDYALIHVIRTGSRRMFAAWWTGVRTAITRPMTTLGLWLLMALGLLVLAAGLFAVLDPLPATTGLLIALAIVSQQIFVVLRIALRVALLAAEGAAWQVIPEPAVETEREKTTEVKAALAADPEADVTPLPAPEPGRA